MGLTWHSDSDEEYVRLHQAVVNLFAIGVHTCSFNLKHKFLSREFFGKNVENLFNPSGTTTFIQLLLSILLSNQDYLILSDSVYFQDVNGLSYKSQMRILAYCCIVSNWVFWNFLGHSGIEPWIPPTLTQVTAVTRITTTPEVKESFSLWANNVQRNWVQLDFLIY